MPGPCRIALVLGLLAGPAFAQQDTLDVTVARGISEQRPFTAAYPVAFSPVEDDNEVTVLSISHSGAPIRCDIMMAAGQPREWSAEAAFSGFDALGIEASWAADFPGFRVVEHTIVNFLSGPALYYRGEAERSPLGFPVAVVHAEATDAGRTYVYECIMSREIAPEAMSTIDFLLANFSTRSDAECCVMPPQRP
jgi:hypothetical protein